MPNALLLSLWIHDTSSFFKSSSLEHSAWSVGQWIHMTAWFYIMEFLLAPNLSCIGFVVLLQVTHVTDKRTFVSHYDDLNKLSTYCSRWQNENRLLPMPFGFSRQKTTGATQLQKSALVNCTILRGCFISEIHIKHKDDQNNDTISSLKPNLKPEFFIECTGNKASFKQAHNSFVRAIGNFEVQILLPIFQLRSFQRFDVKIWPPYLSREYKEK